MLRMLQPLNWTSEYDAALSKLKDYLLNCVVLTHPDFLLPLILLIDALIDVLSAVYWLEKRKSPQLHSPARP